jgi:hypothetical protein
LKAQGAFWYEARRLVRHGHADLVPLVQWTSKVDSSAGYDIRSFMGHGSQPAQHIFIEVKGTIEDKVAFFWSRNEQRVAEKNWRLYFIYAFTRVDVAEHKASGPIRISAPVSTIKPPAYQVEPQEVFVQAMARRSLPRHKRLRCR